MKKRKFWLIAVVLIMIASNIKPVDLILRSIIDTEHYVYTNKSGSWSTSENFFKNRVFNKPDSIGRIPDECLPDSLKADSIVHRAFSKNPLAFWRWRLYFTDPRYKLPYADWDEVLRRRGKNEYRCARL